jgi:hypothetical protein
MDEFPFSEEIKGKIIYNTDIADSDILFRNNGTFELNYLERCNMEHNTGACDYPSVQNGIFEISVQRIWGPYNQEIKSGLDAFNDTRTFLLGDFQFEILEASIPSFNGKTGNGEYTIICSRSSGGTIQNNHHITIYIPLEGGDRINITFFT